MTPRQIAALAVRVLALYTLFNSVEKLSSFFPLTGLYGIQSSLPSSSVGILQAQVLGIFAQCFLLVGFALFLWFFADGLAALMVKDTAEATNLEKISMHEIQVVAISCIGLFIGLQTVSQLISLTVHWFLGSQLWNEDFLFKQLPAMAGALVTLLLSGWLVFGAQGFTKFVRAARDVGRDPVLAEESSED
jgi:hypothetical protein